jgi:hypothetical protein
MEMDELIRSIGSIDRRPPKSSLTYTPHAQQSMAGKALRLLSLPYFPWAAMDWKRYPELMASDILAGLTVGIMLVPQGEYMDRDGGQALCV